MASKNPPVKNAAFSFVVTLFAQDDNQIKTTPTIAAGDFQIIDSAETGMENPDTTPSELIAGTGLVLVTLTAAEMNHDQQVVRWIDASGDEWYSGAIVVHTVASGQQFDNLATASALAVVDGIVDDILVDTGTTLPALITSTNIGSGAISHTINIEVGGVDIAGADVWITSDVGGATVVAGTLSTDAFGNATFMLDAGTYYVWVQKAGYNFTNPVTITVS